MLLTGACCTRVKKEQKLCCNMLTRNPESAFDFKYYNK